MFSYLIRQAEVIDGSGKDPFRADVALQGDRIAAVAPRIEGTADRELRAEGLVAAPGFIDIHSHSDGTIFRHPLSESKTMQGVTLEVIGNCGIGCFPVDPARKEILAEYLKMHDFDMPDLAWRNFNEYVHRVKQEGLGVNLAPLVSHGALRIAVMGAENRAPKSDELSRMQVLLTESLEQGAWGMSTGLIYPPGSFASTEELISLSKIVARYRGLYTSHMRVETSALMQGLDEAMRIGRESGVRVEVSHLKAAGKHNWGLGLELLRRLETARREGVDIAADQYPYEATSTSLSVLVPPWAHEGGVAELLKRLARQDLAARIREEIGKEMSLRGGAENVMISHVFSTRNVAASGRRISEIASDWKTSAEEAVVCLLREEQAAVGAIFFSISEEDITTIMADDRVAVGSDGRGKSADEDSGQATHPRSYGTFVRVLGHYVRERKVLPLIKAIWKMSGLPASRLGLGDRGLLRPGFAADLVLFDPAAVRDTATFIHPHSYAEGIVEVWVNGQQTIEKGKFTGARPGQVLRKTQS